MPELPIQAPVDATEADQRLDEVVAARLGCSRGFVQRMIKQGMVTVNGRPCRKGQRLLAGDRLRWDARVAGAGDRALPNPELPLPVVFEDAHLVVVDKPAGLPSHPLQPGERNSLASALVARYPEMAGVGHSPREPGLVHRLDVDTSGLLIAARSAEAFARLVALLRAGCLEKRYQALLRGHPEPGVYRAYLSARGPSVRVHAQPEATAEPVTTQVEACFPVADHSRVELLVHCAARHQIRAHMGYIGHPLYGDSRYGGQPSYDGGGHVLHASELRFTHPWGGGTLALTADRPERFAACERRLVDVAP